MPFCAIDEARRAIPEVLNLIKKIDKQNWQSKAKRATDIENKTK